jgi:hypothetical protein
MPSKPYDPMKPPDDDWLAIDEGERHELVRFYHKRHGLKPPNMNLHTVAHVSSRTNSRSGCQRSCQRWSD